MEAFPTPTMGPDNEGWRSTSEAPKFTKAVEKEIKILEEMRLNDNSVYTSVKDAQKLYLAFFRYPEGAITIFTEHRGSRYKDKKTKAIIDKREYKTPYEGTRPNCYVAYYTIEGIEHDIHGNEIEIKKNHQCLPSEFAKLIGWKAGDGYKKGEIKPDTTPGMPDQFKDEPKKVAKDRAKAEALTESEK